MTSPDDYTILKSLIQASPRLADRDVVAQTLLEGLNRPFFRFGDAQDPMVSRVVRLSFSTMNRLIEQDTSTAVLLLSLLRLSSQWSEVTKAMATSATRALYSYNAAFLLDVVTRSIDPDRHRGTPAP